MASKVLLGMSGGIDSSVAALLLKKQGFEVIGMSLLTYTSEKELPGIEDAKRLAKKLDIEHHIIDSRKEFKRDVIDYFVYSYLKGQTPNPCIRCNDVIKWKFLYEWSEKLDCDFIATGHYVRKTEKNGIFYIQKGTDTSKDQSYYLWNLNQDTLKKSIFPLGGFHKNDIKELAESNGFLSSGNRKESMGVCFLKNSDYRNFIKTQLPVNHPAIQPGNITDLSNNIIGHHLGYPFYTIGQKRHIENTPHNHCVIKIVPDQNRLIVGNKDELNSKTVSLSNYRITPDSSLWKNRKVFIRIRGIDSSPGYYGLLRVEETSLTVTFDQSVWAITPGQSLVFYNNDIVIGGGIC